MSEVSQPAARTRSIIPASSPCLTFAPRPQRRRAALSYLEMVAVQPLRGAGAHVCNLRGSHRGTPSSSIYDDLVQHAVESIPGK